MQNRILLKSELLGLPAATIVGVAIGFGFGILFQPLIFATISTGPIFPLDTATIVLSAVFVSLPIFTGGITGFSAVRFRIGSWAGAGIGVAILLLVHFGFSSLGLLAFWTGTDFVQRVGFTVVAWIWTIPLALMNLPSVIVVGAVVPRAVRRISWTYSNRLK